MPNPGPQQSKGDLAALMGRIEGEPIANLLKFKILEVAPGYARVSMKMRPEYLNFNSVVFGSIVMSVADHSWSLAINSLSMPSVATQFNIHFLSPVTPEDELTSECKVLRNGRRIGISEMSITNQTGKLIAKATGTTVPLNSNPA
jgi:acyl-CoA thioesterase